MMILGHIINFAHLIFLVIMILNLLIAIISEEYDKVRSNQEVTRFLEKAGMILEAVIHQSHRLCGSATPVGIITILSKKGEDENNEFMGLTNRIRSTIKSSEQRI